MSMFETIGTNNPSYLLANPQDAELIAIPCAPGNGVVPRGTIMVHTGEMGYVPATAEDLTGGDPVMLAVLDETVDTTGRELANDAGTVCEVARAFRTGRLIRNKVMLADEGELTFAVEAVLNMHGIYLCPIVEDDDVGNVQSSESESPGVVIDVPGILQPTVPSNPENPGI